VAYVVDLAFILNIYCVLWILLDALIMIKKKLKIVFFHLKFVFCKEPTNDLNKVVLVLVKCYLY
jgi:hypothetical protein